MAITCKLPYWRNLLKWILRCALGLLIAVVIFYALLFYLLQRNPAAIAEDYLKKLSADTGLAFSFGPVDASLEPFPALSLSDVRISNDIFEFQAAWVTIRPDFLKLFGGSFKPASIDILRPKFRAQPKESFSDGKALFDYIKKQIPEPNSNTDAVAPSWLQDCAIVIRNGQASIRGEEGLAFRIAGVNLQAEIASGMLAGSLRMRIARLARNRDAIFSARNLMLAGTAKPADFFAKTTNIHLNGAFQLKKYFKSFSYNIDAVGVDNGLRVHPAISMILELGPAGVAGKIDGAFLASKTGKSYQFQDVAIALGPDSATFRGDLDFLPDAGPTVNGMLQIHRASLPEWLGFARNLAPGLQTAMDNIINGQMKFQLNSRSLKVEDISAECTGAIFKGSGGVADFAKPVVALDLHAEKVNLGLAIPESLGKPIQSPYYTHPTLTPMPGEPLKPGETGIDYDIRLSAGEALYGPLVIDNASLRIHPGAMDRIGLEDVLLTGEGDFYGGKLNGECILGVDPSLPFYITLDAKKINGAPLGQRIPAFPFRGGEFAFSSVFTSRGRELEPFLEALKGKISLAGKKIIYKNQRQVIPDFTGSLDLRSAALNKGRLGLDGQWSATLKNSDFSASAELNGRIWSSFKDVRFSRLPGSMKLRLLSPISFLPKNSEISCSGSVDFSLSPLKLDASNLEVRAFGTRSKGQFAFSMAGSIPRYSGSLKAADVNLPNLVKNMQIGSIDAPAWLDKTSLQTDFVVKSGVASFTNMTVNASGRSLAGRIECNYIGSKPVFNFNLQIPKLAILPGSSSAKTPSKPWNFSFLRKFDAKGVLKINSFSGWDLQIEDIALPLKMAGGVIEIGPATARFYGAPVALSSKLTTDAGINFTVSLGVHAFNMGALMKGQSKKTAFTGQASIDAQLNGRITAPGQLLGALNGSYSFNAVNGSWQSLNDKGAPTGSATRFNYIKSSGSIARGRMESSNLVLNGPKMEAAGGGWLNLESKKIDLKFNVSMQGLPDFPLYIYGPLTSPTRSIGAGRMMVNAISEVSSGFVDLLGNIAGGIGRLFR